MANSSLSIRTHPISNGGVTAFYSREPSHLSIQETSIESHATRPVSFLEVAGRASGGLAGGGAVALVLLRQGPGGQRDDRENPVHALCRPVCRLAKRGPDAERQAVSFRGVGREPLWERAGELFQGQVSQGQRIRRSILQKH